MLVLAAPRPPESQEVVPEDDATITENFLEPSYTEILQLGALIDPLMALSARARHRQKVRTFTLALPFKTKSGFTRPLKRNSPLFQPLVDVLHTYKIEVELLQ